MRCVRLCWMELLHRKLTCGSRISGSILTVRRQTAMLDTSAMAQQSRKSTGLQQPEKMTQQMKVQVSKRLGPMAEERCSFKPASSVQTPNEAWFTGSAKAFDWPPSRFDGRPPIVWSC